jgi:hypothetical protein
MAYLGKKVNFLNREFRKLLHKQFSFTDTTERNTEVKNAIQTDIWNLFKVLIENDKFSDNTKRQIYRELYAEILRLQNSVKKV